MPLLYYWRRDNYCRDLDMGAGYHLNQANPLMHEIDTGDSLWAFTRRANGAYALAVHLVIQAKTINPPRFRYGRYRVWGNLDTSKYFRLEGQPNIEDLIRSLSCTVNAKILGRAFQGRAAVRKISNEDHTMLMVAAEALLAEPRARLLPEDRLEAELLFADSASVEKFLRDEKPGLVAKRVEYLYREAPNRNKKIVEYLQQLYRGRCQLCEWNPQDKYSKLLSQGHHLHWLSRGGVDEPENMVLICPNHHIAVHRCDAQFDYGDFAFQFRTHNEPLRLNLHLS